MIASRTSEAPDARREQLLRSVARRGDERAAFEGVEGRHVRGGETPLVLEVALTFPGTDHTIRVSDLLKRSRAARVSARDFA